MNTKLTPGPWFVGESLDGLPAIIGDVDSVVAYMPSEADGCTYKPADARLLAAAHRMLEALQSIVDDHEFCKAHPGRGDRGESYAETALLAIAAATGEAE